MEGWIKIHHNFLEWEWFHEEGMVRLFINLLLRANFHPKKWKGVDIRRGQLVTGRHQLSLDTGLSEQTIRTCLKRLEQTGEITLNATNKFTVITVSNYDIYQIDYLKINQQNNDVNASKSIGCDDDCDNANQQLTNNQPATNQQLTNKNEKINQQNNDVNASKSIGCDDDCDNANQQLTNKKIGKVEKSTTTKEYKKERIYKKESSTIVEPKKSLSLTLSENFEKRKNKFYDSLVPFVETYGKETIRAFFDYWTEPNKSKTKMRFEMQPTWETKRRLNKWASREIKYNIKNNGTEYKQQQQRQRAEEIIELNKKLNESDC